MFTLESTCIVNRKPTQMAAFSVRPVRHSHAHLDDTIVKQPCDPLAVCLHVLYCHTVFVVPPGLGRTLGTHILWVAALIQRLQIETVTTFPPKQSLVS